MYPSNFYVDTLNGDNDDENNAGIIVGIPVAVVVVVVVGGGLVVALIVKRICYKKQNRNQGKMTTNFYVYLMCMLNFRPLLNKYQVSIYRSLEIFRC